MILNAFRSQLRYLAIAGLALGLCLFAHDGDAADRRTIPAIPFDQFNSCSELFDATPFDLLLDQFFFRDQIEIPDTIVAQCTEALDESPTARTKYYLGALYVLSGRDEEAWPLLTDAMDQGVMEAQTFLALSISKYVPLGGYHLHYEASLAGWPYGAYFAGAYELVGIGVNPQNTASAIRLLERAADSGVSAANVLLGVIYWNGIGVVPDPPLAIRYWQVAAEAENSYGATFLADQILRKEATNYRAEAIHYYTFAAEKGHPQAQMMLYGLLQSTDVSASQYWLEQSFWNPRKARYAPDMSIEALERDNSLDFDQRMMSINYLW